MTKLVVCMGGRCAVYKITDMVKNSSTYEGLPTYVVPPKNHIETLINEHTLDYNNVR